MQRTIVTQRNHHITRRLCTALKQFCLSLTVPFIKKSHSENSQFQASIFFKKKSQSKSTWTCLFREFQHFYTNCSYLGDFLIIQYLKKCFPISKNILVTIKFKIQLVLSAYNFRMKLLISDHCMQPSSTVSVASEAMAEPSLEMGFNQVVQLAWVRVRLCLSTSSPKAARDRLTLYGVCVLHYFKFTPKLLFVTRYTSIQIIGQVFRLCQPWWGNLCIYHLLSCFLQVRRLLNMDIFVPI